MSESLDGVSISAVVRSQTDQIRWMRAVNANILRFRNLTGDSLVVADDPRFLPRPPIRLRRLGWRWWEWMAALKSRLPCRRT